MTKIKILRSANAELLGQQANEFIKGKKIIDIKHNSTAVPRSQNSLVFYDSILIIYNEE